MKKHLKLNLGCGFDKRKGYLNLDIDPHCNPDKIIDLTKPLPFDDDSAAEIILQDVLEHLIIESAEQLLRECLRVLQQGGRLLVRVPNIFEIVKKYADQPDLMMLFLYGDTSKTKVWGAHKYGYTVELLKDLADRLGFHLRSTTIEDTNNNFELIKKARKKPIVTIQGKGWFPNTKVLEKLGGENITVMTDLLGYIKSSMLPKKIVWCIATPPQTLLGKTLLRVLSRRVTKIFVKNEPAAHFVTTVLKYSHLRTIKISK